jgi:hypothetical protein
MDLELYDPFWSMHPREARCLHSFAAKGLPFMKWALRSPSSAKVAICAWAEFAWVKEYMSSPSILEHLYRTWDKIASPNPAAESPKKEGALNGPNEGWMWADAHDLAASQSKLLKRFELRMIGYCYWDSQRLFEDWGLSDISPPQLNLVPREPNSYSRAWLEQEPQWDFEAYFEGLIIPEGLNWCELADQIQSGAGCDQDELLDFPLPLSEYVARIFG